MREIKFRAWYKGKMYEVFAVIGGIVRISLMRFPFSQEVIPDAIMQYTGLKDGKETDIYEGDIIIVENSEPDENGEYDQITVCKWDKGGFTLEDNAGGHWSRQLFHQPERLEIIGNIYENPELL